jgi:hypothetical protein
MGKDIPIAPSSFAEDGGLLDIPMEDVVSMFADKEKRRYKEARESELEQEVVIGAKTTPMGLVATLDSASNQLGLSRAMLTRCLSHQISVWFDSLPNLGQLSELYYRAHNKAVSTGHPELCINLRDGGYTYVNTLTRNPTTFRSISWLQNKLSKMVSPLGLPVSILFHTGLCWSLSTSKCDVYCLTVDGFLRPEVERFTRYVGARFIQVKSFSDLVDYYVELKS